MAANWKNYLADLTPLKRESPRLKPYFRGFADIGESYTEDEIRTVPERTMIRSFPQFFGTGDRGLVTQEDSAEALGYLMDLWKTLTTPPAGGFSAQYAADSLNTFTVPFLNDAQNSGVRRLVFNKHMVDLSQAQKTAVLAALAKEVKQFPWKEPTVMTFLPGIMLEEFENFVEAPLDQLEKLTKVPFFADMKKILLFAGIGLAAIFLAPQIMRTVKAARR
jgi:hypothetical protein